MLPRQIFKARAQIAITHNPQLSVRYSLENKWPRLDHLPVSLVLLSRVEPADHKNRRRIERRWGNGTWSRAHTEVNGAMWHLQKGWIALDKSLPCVVAIGED